MRTLCVACHYEVTAVQCAERRKVKANARKQLKVLMNSLKYGKTGASDTNIEVCTVCKSARCIGGHICMIHLCRSYSICVRKRLSSFESYSSPSRQMCVKCNFKAEHLNLVMD